MKIVLPFFIVGWFLCSTIHVFSQVAINTDATDPHPSAMLDIVSTSRGLLLPRMTTSQRNTLGGIATAGLVVYDTDLKKLFIHDGITWSDNSSSGYWQRSGNRVYLSEISDSVGIGTATPARKFEVRGNWLTARLSTNNSGAFLEFVGNNATDWAIGGWDGSARLLSSNDEFQTTSEQYMFTSTAFHPYSSNSKTLGTQYQRWLRLYGMKGDFSDSVGIGTTSPARPLEVRTTGYRSARFSSAMSGAIIEFVGSQNTDWNIGSWEGIMRIGSSTDDFTYNSTDEYFLGTASFGPVGTGKTLGTDYYRWNGLFSTNGNFSGDITGTNAIFTGTLGVGTTNQMGRLHVHDETSNAQVYLTPGTTISGDNSTLFFAEDATATFGMFWKYNGGSNFMELWGHSGSSDFGPHMLVERNTGNVALGSTFASGYRLSVDGKIICSEVRVSLTAGWPDYVFHDDYKLLPIEKLGNFIEEKGHLPNIPSAAEIGKSGVELGEMQRMMMEKIEEMSLYIIDLQKQIKVQQEQINGLKAILNDQAK